ncbi:MAG: hypothetical protein HC940_01540 [Acaryochloris sp. SU_5_25]|nr:hypothetical protein [Acaryochloris sp. SU_5_25]
MNLKTAVSVDGKQDWAFIPSPLPEDWTVPDEIWELLAQAREELALVEIREELLCFGYSEQQTGCLGSC